MNRDDHMSAAVATDKAPQVASRPEHAPNTREDSNAAIPFHEPSIGPEEEREVLDTLRSGWLTTGPKTKRFERLFARYVGAEHAVALNSCTAALHLALYVHGIGPGDEVITTPITFAATVNVIEHVGARPVFVDVQQDTLNLDPLLVERAITPRTRAVIPVHFAGHPCDLKAIHDIADRHELVVIEDAAHAVGASYHGRRIGGLSPVTAFSFYATKNMTTGEGGMITTDDEDVAARLRILSLHGISVDAWKRCRRGAYKHWDIVEPGFKYNMFDIQSSIGMHQLAKLDGFIEARQRWTRMYDDGFADTPEITPLSRREGITSAYHLYVIRLARKRLRLSRDEFMGELQDRGVGVGVHFRPVHLHPYYREKYGFAPGALPVAEEAGESLLSLPLFPTMTARQVTEVIRRVRDLIAGCCQ